MELHLKIIGIIFIFLALLHAGFPKHFNWKKEFQSVSLINTQMMYVHTFFISLTVFLMGIFCIYSADEIVNTKIGKEISFGFFIFWATRLIFQFFVYSPKLWKGKTFETIMHIAFSILWTYLTAVFFLIWYK